MNCKILKMEIKKLIEAGILTNFKEVQEKLGVSRTKVENMVKAGLYEKIKLHKTFILIKTIE